jgi:transposase
MCQEAKTIMALGFAKGGLGARSAISLVALWHTVMCVLVRSIRALLSTLHGVNVSIGEISEVLHHLVAHAQPALDQLKQTLRASPAIQADETGWRAR